MRRDALQRILTRAGIDGAIVRERDLSGGCIHHVMSIELEDGRRLVAKISSIENAGMFESEAASLSALSETKTVLTPEPFGVLRQGDRAVLLLSFLQPGNAAEASWRSFGEELAALHRCPMGARYGFDLDNHLGATPQPNSWSDDWVAFNAEHRLGFQVKLALDAGRLGSDEAKRLDSLIDRLDRVIPRHPKPALLHGDLWSGNALPTVDGQGRSRIAVIDPATYVGDGWADIAMMRLFGGFSPACFEAYAALNDDRADLERRIGVYQLYHVLNHLNLFGRGYAGQAMGLVDRLE